MTEMENDLAKKKNDGKAYEQFTQEVLQRINALEGLTTVFVKPSEIFDGNTFDEEGVPIPHQIDVHWTFRLNNIEYTTVIQAKDWNSQVPLKEMIAFDGIVKDIGNEYTKGIFVAKSGFQRGAISWAKAKKIKAAELRRIFPAEKANRIETIHLTIKAMIPTIQITSLDLKVWLESLSEEHRAKCVGSIGLDPNRLRMTLENGLDVGTLRENIKWDIKNDAEFFEHTQVYDPALFFEYVPGVPNARLEGLTANIRQHVDVREIVMHWPLTHILRSTTGDESYFVSVNETTGKMEVKRATDLDAPIKPRPKSSW